MNLLLLREPRYPTDPYHSVLNELGKVASIPVLFIRFIEYSSVEAKLMENESCGSIVFTSANAVKAFKNFAQAGINFNIEKWIKKECFVVGKATEKVAKDLGFHCSGSTSGNAEELAKFIIQEKCGKPMETILFPCGQMKRETLPDMLGQAEIPLKCVTVYETTEHPDILNSIKNYRAENPGPVFVVFFSPSGVSFALQKIREVYADIFSSLHICAIGNTTAEALNAMGQHPCSISESPSPGGLLNTLRSLTRSSS